jgi:hypothetical protein
LPYVLPTAAEFKARFEPSFDSLSDAYIDAMIAEAARNVDETWEDLDYQPAIMFLTAHNISEEQSLGGIIGAPGMITSEKLGDAQDTYAANGSIDALSIYGGTVYGRRFAQLQRVNVPAVALL